MTAQGRPLCSCSTASSLSRRTTRESAPCSRHVPRRWASGLSWQHDVLPLEMACGSRIAREAAKQAGVDLDARRKGTASRARGLKIGLAATVGGAALVLTGGLAAPFVAAGAATLVGTVAGTTAAVGAGLLAAAATPVALGWFGAHAAGKSISRRTNGIQQFSIDEAAFASEHAPEGAPVAVKMQFTIVVSGWLDERELKAAEADELKAKVQATQEAEEARERAAKREAEQAKLAPKYRPLSRLGGKLKNKLAERKEAKDERKREAEFKAKEDAQDGMTEEERAEVRNLRLYAQDWGETWAKFHATNEFHVLRWESPVLLEMGDAYHTYVTESVKSVCIGAVVKKTVLGPLVAFPSALLSISHAFDNPFSMCMDRARKAAPLLADTLAERALGKRPVTLVAYSVGALLVFEALKILAERRLVGVVENVYFLGAAVSTDGTREWEAVRGIVAGRFCNAYLEKDWLLSFLFRALDRSARVAGLGIVPAPGVRNVNLSGLSDRLSSHIDYRTNLSEILTFCDFLA